MQIFRIFGQNYKEILLGSVFLYSNIVLVKSLILHKFYVKKIKEIQEKKIITMQEALEISKMSQSLKNADTTYLIKVYPSTDQKKIVIMKPLASNQLWLIEPSLNKVVNDVASLFTRNYVQKDKKSIKKLQNQKIWHNPTWNAKYRNNSNQLLTQIQGFGEILDHEIFDVKCKYYPNEEKSLLKTILENIAYFFQLFMLQRNRMLVPPNARVAENQARSPFIKGPIIGHVFYLIDFLKDRPILLEAKIQNQSIISLAIAGSKEKILQSLNLKIWNVNFSITFFMVVSYFSFRLLNPRWKNIVRKIKNKIKTLLNRQKIRGKQPHEFISASEKLSDKKLCIICYTNCRNTLIFNCRHMIMCNECKDIYKNNSCPLCKKEIDDHKIIYEF